MNNKSLNPNLPVFQEPTEEIKQQQMVEMLFGEISRQRQRVLELDKENQKLKERLAHSDDEINRMEDRFEDFRNGRLELDWDEEL
jgi:predicted nuclease with TOPRIM domain